jgi:hypothetical protein
MFKASSSQILSSKRFKNGVVHELSELMRPLTNMFDYIGMLSDDYSIIRDSILFYNVKMFDRDNSTPVSVDESGNTVYDSVFYYTNPLFDQVNLASEFDQFTMFLPSNDVIANCFAQMHNQYQMMGKTFTQADTLLAINWMKETIFQKGIIRDYHEQLDLTSPFSASNALRVWRTSVQQVDEENVDELSNGLVYKVTSLKVPNNVLITRIKSLVHYYEYLTDEQKALYTGAGILTTETSNGFDSYKGDATPVPEVLANYWLFRARGIAALDDAGVYKPEEEQVPFWVEFPPIDYNSATGETKIMKVPSGEYNLYMGFLSKNHAYVDVFFHSGADNMPDDTPAVQTEINVTNSTPWNYDRVNETNSDTKTPPIVAKWNGLGGLVGIVNVEGNNEMQTFRIRVKFNKQSQATATTRELRIYHWCLKPTSNNY